MTEPDNYFPRGGKKPSKQFYKQNNNFLGTLEKGEKRKKKPAKQPERDDGYLSDEFDKEFATSQRNCANGISYKTAKEGVLLLGRVRLALDTKIHVSLPSRMNGVVMACHISEAYNKLLEAYVNDQVEQVKELPKMFRVGQYVAVRVLEGYKEPLMLSMMPQHVNRIKQHADIVKGTLLQAAVTSEEDHGYVMELGVPNVRAFLPKGNADKAVELDTGVLTWCVVHSVASSPDSSVVTLSNKLTALQDMTARRELSGGLLPGTAVLFHVDKALDNGIEGQIFRTTTSYIQQQHADKVKGKKPALGQKVCTRLLYEMPTTKTPFLTLKNIFENFYPDLSKERKYRDGDVVENAQVIKITGRSILFKLGQGCMGNMNLKRVQVHEDLSDEDVVSKYYPLGSEHKVRILCYHLSDYRYSVSDQPEVLNEQYFSYDNISVGDIVDATVKSVTDNHIILNVGRITGVVTQMHISDAGIYLDPKKVTSSKLPSKKYKVGQQVKARVLYLDEMKSAFQLTLKPSLLVPHLEVLKSYENVIVGNTYTGYVKTVKDYIIVSFFNRVQAIVPKQFVTTEPVANLSDAFHFGQIVNCIIIKVNPEEKKMKASLIALPFDPTKPQKKGVKRTQVSKVEPEVEVTSTEPIAKKKKTNETKLNEAKNKDKKNKKTDSDKGKRKNVSEGDCKDISSDINKQKKKEKKLKKSGKDKKANILEESDAVEADLGEKSGKVEKKKKNDKTLKKPKVNDKVKKVNVSEESDEIETDFNEDSDIAETVLKPEDINLINLDNCATPMLKKRVLLLRKSMEKRSKRLTVVNNKIEKIKEKDMKPIHKKFHKLMKLEKIVIEKRKRALTKALQMALDKLAGADGAKSNKKANKKENKIKKQKEDKPVELIKNKVKELKVAESLTPALELPSVKSFWSTNLERNNNQQSKNDEDSSNSEDEVQEQPKKKRKKLTVSEKVAKVREEEERLREMEKRVIQNENNPHSTDQFERSLLDNPNSSELWIAYMAFHLQATEVNKARAVGRKALSTISFREEQEKLNVWISMLHLENLFGTKESQQTTLDEALQMNDTFKIHSKLLDIYVETAKQAELNSLVEVMLRKYRRDPQTYTMCGSACYKLAMVDKARYVMQKAISVLEKKEHVPVIVQFGLLERSFGSQERAEALFEQILGSYPQRVDVCCTYVDMLFKNKDIENVRQVMERMTSQQLPARKIKVLFKKWIEIEEKVGDAEHISNVRRKAMEFVENAKF